MSTRWGGTGRRLDSCTIRTTATDTARTRQDCNVSLRAGNCKTACVVRTVTIVTARAGRDRIVNLKTGAYYLSAMWCELDRYIAKSGESSWKGQGQLDITSLPNAYTSVLGTRNYWRRCLRLDYSMAIVSLGYSRKQIVLPV